MDHSPYSRMYKEMEAHIESNIRVINQAVQSMRDKSQRKTVYRVYISTHNGEDTVGIYAKQERAEGVAEGLNSRIDTKWEEAMVDEWELT